MVKPYYLANVIANFPACKSSTDCQKIISNALNYHLNLSEGNNIDVGELKPRGFRSGNIYIISNDSITPYSNGSFGNVIDFDNQEQVQNMFRGITVLNGKVYITGGLHSGRGRVINDVNEYSCDNNNLTLVTPMNYPRCRHGCCVHADSCLYVVEKMEWLLLVVKSLIVTTKNGNF